jgi:hypothetical protein
LKESLASPLPNKTLFVSVCQTYEQNSVETSCIASASSQSALNQAFSFSYLVPEGALPRGLAAMLEGDAPLRQNRGGFSAIGWPNVADFDDWSDFDDWDKRG